MIAYSVVATAILFSTVQFNFLAYHYIGALLLAIVALVAGRYLASRRPPRWLAGRRATVFGVLVLGMATLVVGCGSDKRTDQELAQTSIAERPPPLEKVLIQQKDVLATKAGTVERAFLLYWSGLQHQAFADAAGSYDPGLIEAIGLNQIVEALKSQAPYFRSVRPSIESATSEGGLTTLKYLVRDEKNTVVPRSLTFRRINDDWRIYYDPFLDLALQAYVQNATQVAIDPRAGTIHERSIVAGAGASRLQSDYLHDLYERRAERRAAESRRQAAERRREQQEPAVTPTPVPDLP